MNFLSFGNFLRLVSIYFLNILSIVYLLRLKKVPCRVECFRLEETSPSILELHLCSIITSFLSFSLFFLCCFCFKLGEKHDFHFLFVLSFPLLLLFLLLVPPPPHLPYSVFHISKVSLESITWKKGGTHFVLCLSPE